MAIIRIGAVAFLLSATLKVDEISKIIINNKIDAAVILSDLSADHIELLKAVVPKVFRLSYDGLLKFEVIKNNQRIAGSVAANGYVLRMTSSGSTGEVKQMLRTQSSLLHMGQAIKDVFALNDTEVMLDFVPPAHIMGIGQIILTFYLEATLLLEQKFVPSKIIADVAKFKATWMMAAPFVLDILATSSDPQVADWSAMKNAISASSPLPERVYYNFRTRCQIPLHEIYGSTEATIVTAEIDDGIFKPNVVGKPVGSVKIKIVDDDFNKLPQGQVGNIATASPMVINGYDNNEAATQASFIDGFVLVGDRGFMDEQGQLHVVGRTNDVINVAGNKVDPVEVEQTVAAHPAVKEVAVYGAGSDSIQVVKAAVVLKAEVDAASLIRFCQDKLSGYKVPKEIKFIAALPRNSTGKLMRQQLVND